MGIEPRFEQRLEACRQAVESRMASLLSAEASEGLGSARLGEAMRYATLGGGKRFRPFLVVETAALFGVPQAKALDAAAAVECIHCYSLVHDDLPAMDDDDLRRGRPTVHKAFDEATAILAGDALLTFAFEILGRPDTGFRSRDPQRACSRPRPRLGLAGHGRRADARPRRRGLPERSRGGRIAFRR